MRSMGLTEIWIRWIMMCIESVSFFASVNGTPFGMIKSNRGIRQGDLLSLYIFILSAEVLSHLFTQADGSRQLKGMKISQTWPDVNHLLFADDALFFCHAHPKSCKTIMRILTAYERALGQAINLNKSAITFGGKVRDEVKTRLRGILQIQNDGGCGKYLGLPEHVGRKKNRCLNTLLRKFEIELKVGLTVFSLKPGKRY